MIAAGAQLDLRGGKGWTALVVAAGAGHTEAVLALMSAGANINSQDDCGISGLIGASCNGHTSVVKALIAGAILCSTFVLHCGLPFYLLAVSTRTAELLVLQAVVCLICKDTTVGPPSWPRLGCITKTLCSN